MKNNKYDIVMLKTAVLMSELSFCKKRQVGCVIATEDGNILSNAYNGTIKGAPNCCEDYVIYCSKCNKIHQVSSDVYKVSLLTKYSFTCDNCGCRNDFTDVKKFIQAVTNEFTLHAEQNAIVQAGELGNPIKGATVYVTTSPCKTCSKLLAKAGIKRVVYLDHYKDTSGIDFLKKLNIDVEQLSLGE